jgi:integrase
VLSAVLGVAVADGLVPSNAARGVRVPRDPRPPADRAATLTGEQLEALVDALPDRLRAYALTLAWLGLRPSEGAGLTVDRVDWLRGRVSVDRQLVRSDSGTPVFGPVKTAASVRELPLPDELRDELAAHVDRYGLGIDGLLFRTRTGAPLGRSVRGDAWRRAARDLEVPDAVRGWHSLRHTYASTLLGAGTDLPTVARLLGHASITETATTYAHALPGRDDVVRNVAASALPVRVLSVG